MLWYTPSMANDEVDVPTIDRAEFERRMAAFEEENERLVQEHRRRTDELTARDPSASRLFKLQWLGLALGCPLGIVGLGMVADNTALGVGLLALAALAVHVFLRAKGRAAATEQERAERLRALGAEMKRRFAEHAAQAPTFDDL